MKSLIKNPKTYLVLIILAPTIMLGGFLLNYYQIYKNVADPFSMDPNTSNSSIVVKNPFESIESIEDIENIEDIESLEDITDPTENTGIADVTRNIKENQPILNSEIISEKKDPSLSKPSEESKQPTGPNKATTSNKTDKKSYNYIVSTYKAKFEKLQQKQESNLYSLIEQGKVEYIERKEKKTSIVSLANKYLTQVNDMEKQSDQEFNSLVNNFKNELTNYSYNTDIVNEIKDYYNYYKKTLRAQLFKKASEHL